MPVILHGDGLHKHYVGTAGRGQVTVRRFEIATGKSIEWWILPVRTGVFDDVISTKKLALDGMKATITVVFPQNSRHIS